MGRTEVHPKTVTKPWGKEVWIELNDKYCFKELHLKQGNRTSFQYHQKKHETGYVIKGKLELWLENDKGEIIKKIMEVGDFYIIKPLKKHRMIAIEDAVYLEASTPEVDDVIRLEDDVGRPNGKIKSEHSK